MSLVPDNSTEMEMQLGGKHVPTWVMDKDAQLSAGSWVTGSLASEVGALDWDPLSTA